MDRFLNKITCGDNCDLLGLLPRECIDLVVTSPPYDDLRTYGGHTWGFYGVAWQLKRVLKPGGVIVWVVADATKDGSESGTSMEQALFFKRLGLNLHDTMIYSKGAQGGAKGSKAYTSLKGLTAKEYPKLIPELRSILKSTGKPWVMENVVGSELINPIQLCGSSFGLNVWRHRLFEMSHQPALVPMCAHYATPEPIDVTGTGGRRRNPGRHRAGD